MGSFRHRGRHVVQSDGQPPSGTPTPRTRRRRHSHRVTVGPLGLAARLASILCVPVLVPILVVAVIVYRPIMSAGASFEHVRTTMRSSKASGTSDAPAASDPNDSADLLRLSPAASFMGAPERLTGDPSRRRQVSVMAVGDVIFDRGVREVIESEGPLGPLADVAPVLRRAEVTIANLENPMSFRGEEWPGKGITFEGAPACIGGLLKADINVVSLANNHSFDYGYTALADTIRLLDRSGITHAGAGANARDAWRPAIITVKGKTLAYLAFSDVHPDGYVIATSDSPGIAPADGNTRAIVGAIRSAKRTADFVIVSFHWGVEYTDYPIDDQRELARAAVDAGADMVAAHHPHVIQGIEVYKRRLIAYSLGDFVFDHKAHKCGEAFILEATIGNTRTISARAIPVYLTDAGKPSVVTGSEADEILGRLEEISAGFGTRMSVSNSTATLKLP